jgi:hypothetical protein
VINRNRLIALAVVCVIAIGGAGAFLIKSHSDRQSAIAAAPKVQRTNAAQIQSSPHIVFRNTALGWDYGKVSMVALANPGGARAITGTECDRVYAASAKVLCLSSNRGLVTTYQAQVLSQDLRPMQNLPLAGIPSRARLSGDASLAATTSFTAGDSYAGTNFSTRTVISTVGSAAQSDLETYRLSHDGADIRPSDRNFWGVTFAKDDDLFYATVAWGGHTWLVRGSVKNRVMTTLHADAECPSLSPDGTRVVYKKRAGAPAGHWRLASYDLATGQETMLAETRSVDDQVEWLDNQHVIYGLPRTGSQAAIDDIYSVPADGSGAPALLIQQAWSPAVVR